MASDSYKEVKARPKLGQTCRRLSAIAYKGNQATSFPGICLASCLVANLFRTVDNVDNVDVDPH
jgi:hypothetical protein